MPFGVLGELKDPDIPWPEVDEVIKMKAPDREDGNKGMHDLDVKTLLSTGSVSMTYGDNAEKATIKTALEKSLFINVDIDRNIRWHENTSLPSSITITLIEGENGYMAHDQTLCDGLVQQDVSPEPFGALSSNVILSKSSATIRAPSTTTIVTMLQESQVIETKAYLYDGHERNSRTIGLTQGLLINKQRFALAHATFSNITL
ncbi:hypothetical protein V8B97DRAFT_2111801 [Scleroderma yunnanense]